MALEHLENLAARLRWAFLEALVNLTRPVGVSIEEPIGWLDISAILRSCLIS